jgi:hypothetical protein
MNLSKRAHASGTSSMSGARVFFPLLAAGMASKPFTGPKLKLARGRKHVADLKAEISDYLSRDNWAVVLERHKQTGECRIALRGRLIPDDFSAIFGDAVHNLRTALDILANDLVALSGATPKKVYFPFADSGEALEPQIQSKMKGASPDVLNIIRSLKPYRGGNELLRAIHDLDIRDKHVAIIAAGASAVTDALRFRQIPDVIPGRKSYQADFSLSSVTPIDTAGFNRDATTDDHEVLGKMAGSEVSLIIGRGPSLTGEPVIATLNKMANLVQRIVETFEAHCLGGK